MSDTDESGLRERVRFSAENKAESLHVTYDQHFSAANFYRWANRAIDTVIFAISGVLVSSAIWKTLPVSVIIGLTLTIAGLSGYRRAVKPDKRAERFRESARAYHALFEEFRDFLMLDIPSDEYSDEDIRQKHDELASKRRELNTEMPDASSIWYHYVERLKGEKQRLKEISTSQTVRETLSGRDIEEP